MKPIRVAAGVVNQTPLDWQGNFDRIVEAMDRARSAGADLICLPELCVTGYGCEDMFFSPAVQRRALESLVAIAAHSKDLIVSVGLPLWYSGNLYNMAALLVDGRISGLVGKQNLAGEGVHYEPRWFSPWPAHHVAHARLDDRDVPIGDLVFDVGGIRIGFEICRDAWVATRPGGDLIRNSVDLILNPSASHFAFGKHLTRRRFVLEGSRAFQSGYIYTNLLGNEAGKIIYDGDALIASCGKLLASCPRFRMSEVEIVTATFDVEHARMLRAQWRAVQPGGDEPSRIVSQPFRYREVPFCPTQPVPPPAEDAQWKLRDFTDAVTLGLFDYLRKSRLAGFVVSLSGGADSCAVALLCRLMLDRAWDELGREAVCRKLAAVPQAASCDRPIELMPHLLTTIYQSTANSSQTTRDAARRVSEAIGARHLEVDVDGMVSAYVQTATAALQRAVDWVHDDAALQNIQARSRAPLAWFVANLNNALLLVTSNRSEGSVGYATMDGDTAGGLAPIGGIDKSFLRRWLKWLEREGLPGREPMSFLEVVTRQSPKAELRPATSEQTDEGDLMPYEVLDQIERAAIRDKRSPLEVYQQMLVELDGRYQPDTIRMWVRKFFSLWARNQWKRERYAPSFHLDDLNIDPRTWCRFPILSGGFERELEELGG